MATRIQIRRDTSIAWEANNPVLALGEPGLETDTFIVKYGDGSTAWNSLPYANIDSLADFTTANLVEQSNLYFTNARVYANIVSAGFLSSAYATNAQLASYATTANLSSYATNNQLGLYATNADLIANYLTTEFVDVRLQNYARTSSLTTANVSELTNLYYSNARVYGNVLSLSFATNAQFNALTTSSIPESGNLYFTNARVVSAITTQTLPNATFSGNVSGIAEIGKTTSSANSIGYLGLPQNIQNSNYTLVIGDMGKHMFATANLTFTIPSRISVPYPIGAKLNFVANASCTANIDIINDVIYFSNSGATGMRTLTQFGEATALKVADSIWIISGTGLS
jgi:hypothetical protein